MKKHFKTAKKKYVQLATTFLTLLFVFAPIVATGNWIIGVTKMRDTRKVFATPTFMTRSIDQTADFVPFSDPVLTIAFDDGWESVYSQAFPIMQRAGFRSSQYIIADSFDNRLYMSKAQVESMQKAGTEIASHTLTHKELTTLSDAELDAELSKSKSQLETIFKNQNTRVQEFASPLGAYDDRTIAAIKKHYRSHKNAEGDPDANELQSINTEFNFDVYNIVSYSVRINTKPEDLQRLINYTIKNNAWLVLTYHQIDNSGELFSVTPSAFAEQMTLLSNAKVKSATLGQFLDKYTLISEEL